MNEDELRKFLKSLDGWGLHFRSRRKTGKRYAYARRKRAGKVTAIYLCPEDKIGGLIQEDVAKKLS